MSCSRTYSNRSAIALAEILHLQWAAHYAASIVPEGISAHLEEYFLFKLISLSYFAQRQAQSAFQILVVRQNGDKVTRYRALGDVIQS